MAERPADMATRPAPGHWEGDLLKDARNGSAVGILVERTTRLGLLVRMEGNGCEKCPRGFHEETPERAHAAAERTHQSLIRSMPDEVYRDWKQGRRRGSIVDRFSERVNIT